MAEFNYVRDHSRSLYNAKGVPFACHSKEDEVRAKEQGFTSATYVPSQWPKTVFHKKTGESKVVGKLEWDEEKNAAAVVALGPDWTLDHVAVPAPVSPAAPSAGINLDALLSIAAEMKLMNTRLSDLEDAAAEAAGIRTVLESRVGELEGLLQAEMEPAGAAEKKGKK